MTTAMPTSMSTSAVGLKRSLGPSGLLLRADDVAEVEGRRRLDRRRRTGHGSRRDGRRRRRRHGRRRTLRDGPTDHGRHDRRRGWWRWAGARRWRRPPSPSPLGGVSSVGPTPSDPARAGVAGGGVPGRLTPAGFCCWNAVRTDCRCTTTGAVSCWSSSSGTVRLRRARPRRSGGTAQRRPRHRRATPSPPVARISPHGSSSRTSSPGLCGPSSFGPSVTTHSVSRSLGTPGTRSAGATGEPSTTRRRREVSPPGVGERAGRRATAR